MISFENQKALVTGGSRGIGKAITEKLESLGCEVRTLSSKDGDLSNKFALNYLKNQLLEDNFDIIINNAGICINNFIWDIKMEEFDKVQMVNVNAPLYLTKFLSKKMIDKGYGRIVNISSIKGSGTSERRLAYTTSKSALNGMTRAMAVDLAPYGVLVNTVSPGFTWTELTKSMLSEKDIEELTKRIPMGRFAKVDEIANVVSFFASKENSFVTGQDIIVDGGYTINL